MSATPLYIRECGTCYRYAVSDDPKEERMFRDCPVCKKGMFLIGPPLTKDHYPLGDKIDLPPSYKTPPP